MTAEMFEQDFDNTLAGPTVAEWVGNLRPTPVLLRVI
jgi:hypothetical protein